jgi:hypothetical protein
MLRYKGQRILWSCAVKCSVSCGAALQSSSTNKQTK